MVMFSECQTVYQHKQAWDWLVLVRIVMVMILDFLFLQPLDWGTFVMNSSLYQHKQEKATNKREPNS